MPTLDLPAEGMAERAERAELAAGVADAPPGVVPAAAGDGMAAMLTSKVAVLSPPSVVVGLPSIERSLMQSPPVMVLRRSES